MRPVIGIAGILTESPSDSPFAAWKRDITSEAYTRSVASSGALPVMLPLLDDSSLAAEQVSLVDGLLIQGGEDVEPSLYGEEKHPLCGRTDEKTDRSQIALILAAISLGKPVFGICRGIQIINVALGGTLHQDCSLKAGASFNHNHREQATLPCHPIEAGPSSFLSPLFPSRRFGVNSLHHQEIKALGSGLSVAARCPLDGCVEAIEDRKRKIFAVQWHPEAMMMRDSSMLPLWRFWARQCEVCRTA